MSREYVIALRDSLIKKKKVLEEIKRICDMQSDLLSKDKLDMERFDSLMDERDICLQKIDKLDEGFELVYERVKGELQNNKSAYSAEIKEMQQLITDITDLGTSINAKDERNKTAVQNAFIKERRGIAENRRSVNVAVSYYKSMSGMGIDDSRRMDKKK